MNPRNAVLSALSRMRLVPHFLRRGPWRRLSDLDVLHSFAIATLACFATGGVLFIAYFVHTLRKAVDAPVTMQQSRVLLLFGKRLNKGKPDADYLARIARAHEQIQAQCCDRVLLLGGASDAGDGEAGDTEAAAAQRELLRKGVPARVELVLEDRSIDTLENLRNARKLLADAPRLPVALLSSRYHLARCAWLAGQLGFDCELCAAEDRFVSSFAGLRRIALEAGYILWADVGTRWARLIRNERMLRRVT
jgi:uncharacterized SAM-binding protein YcdF (DUF218 family)